MSKRYLPIQSCVECPFVVLLAGGAIACTNAGPSKERPRHTTVKAIPAWCRLPELREE